MSRDIHVFADWEALGGGRSMGMLRADLVHGKETFSFEYAREWLAGEQTMLLDPELQLFEGPQFVRERTRPNFGLFLDSSPDRWGQLLMTRREALDARVEKRTPRVLRGTDFLLGVHDEQRVGGLRLKTETNGEFLSSEEGQNAPPWARLRELEQAARRVQADDGSGDAAEMREWLRLLMAPGSSIGGARPKAGVRDEDGNLWIAKFPGRNDGVDVGAWEMVTHRLAADAGLHLPEARLETFGRSHGTFMVKRFDRVVASGARRRLHFGSAMTMLGYSDGTNFKDGASYLDLVEFLTRHGAEPTADMQELWRRIVFSICVSNTDDHLRNHGFLLREDGWKLSPAYDLNPEPAGTGLSLNISDTDNSLNLDLAVEVAPFFRMGEAGARSVITEVKKAVSPWRAVAAEWGISRSEQESMSPAFRFAD